MNTREAAPLTGWRVGDAGFTVFGPKTDAPTPTVILNGKDRVAVRLAAAAPDLLAIVQKLAEHYEAGEEVISFSCLSDHSDDVTLGDMVKAATLRATEGGK